MIKIKEIKIQGFRGIKGPLMLNLDNKSILIFGENSSGKSSVTDAIEWYYFDGIKHLSNKEAGGRTPLRNLFIPDNEEAFARIVYSDNLFDNKKTINGLLKTTTSNDTEGFNEYLSDSRSENLILRYRDLLQFIISTPSERLEKLQDIIGFSEVAEIRSLLKRSAGRIERAIKNASYDDQKNAQQSTIIENLGQNAYNDDEFFAGAEHLIRHLQIKKTINSHQSIQDFLKMIEAEEDTALLKQINFYRSIEEKITEILGTIDNIHISYSDYHALFVELCKDPEKIQKLQLLDLLKQGQDVLKNDIVQGDYCPLCQQEKSKIELLRELNERIQALEDLEHKRDRLEVKRQSIKDILRLNLNTIDGLLRDKFYKEADQAGLLQDIEQVRASIVGFLHEIEKELFSKDPILEPEKINIDKKEISKIVKKAKEEVELVFDDHLTVCHVISDRNLIHQVISNFVNNAMKFTSEGSIHVGYKLKDGELEFYVEDTGIGIEKEQLPHIFERFVKLNSFVHGTGLGLSICQSIVEQLGGRIGVDSEKGKGSRFWFTIPGVIVTEEVGCAR